MNQPTKPGFYYGIPFEDYRTWPAVNFSLLKEMDKTPLHCRYRQQHPSESTEEMAVGSAAHCRILEPGKWEDRFYVCPPCKLNTKEGKAVMAEAVEMARGRTIVRMEQDAEASAAEQMAESIRHHKLAQLLIDDIGKCEVSALWFDELNQLWCKGRFDKLNIGVKEAGLEETIIEIKTSGRIDDWAFARTAKNLHYDAQLAWYAWGHACITGESSVRCRIIAIESKPPFAVRVLELDTESSQAGTRDYSRWYGEYCRCVRSGAWPGYPDRVEKIKLPDYSTELELMVAGKEYAY